MKKFYYFILLLFLFGSSAALKAQKDSTHFVFTIQTDTSDIGLTNDSSFFINTDSKFLYDYDIDWNNDGIFDTTNVKRSISHQYDSAGTYTIRIKGTFPRFFVTTGRRDDREKLISIDQWGTIQWKSFHRAFTNCINMKLKTNDTPNLDSVTDLSYAFFKINSLNESIEDWDVSAVQNMRFLFRETPFNQNIGNWDVSAVTNMSGMFWEVTNFNQNIGNWNTSNVENMWAMFNTATAFNQDIGNWDVSKVVEMGNLFLRATSFNQDISNWDVSKAKYIYWMFHSASAFNQDIGNWKVDSVELASGAFQNATSFNQNLSKWNVSKVRDMSKMFSGAKNFNQDLGSWDINSIDDYSSLLGLFDSSGLSMENYDNTLISWQNKPHPDSVRIGAWGMTFCSADSARTQLINNDGWIFTGDSLVNDCITGIKENNKTSALLTVYPNPTRGLLSINLQKNQELISIYNSNARLIKKLTLSKGINQIDLSEYSNGIYFIRSGNQSEKVMVLH